MLSVMETWYLMYEAYKDESNYLDGLSGWFIYSEGRYIIGMCSFLRELLVTGKISWDTWRDMRWIINDDLDRIGAVYLFPISPEGFQQRAEYCYKQWLELKIE